MEDLSSQLVNNVCKNNLSILMNVSMQLSDKTLPPTPTYYK